MIRPILVTGATGFLGSHVVCELFRAGLGSRVHLMLRSEPRADSLIGLRFRDEKLDLKDVLPRLHFADLSDGETFRETLRKLQTISHEWVVIHLAAIINAKGDEETQEKVNYDRTLEILEWSNSFASRFVFTSSIVAFGGSPSHELRTEADYSHYHWLNKMDGYSRSKRKAHDSILQIAKVPTVVLCPGIIHGAYEHKKSSRAHLELVLQDKVRWMPAGKGAFVSLSYVGEHLLQAALAPEFAQGIHVRLLNDVCMNYVDYFNLYRECAGKERLHYRRIPSVLVYPVAFLYGLARVFGKKLPLLGKLIQALMNYDFKTERTFTEGKSALKNALIQSFQKRG